MELTIKVAIQIDHVPPRMAGHMETTDFNLADVKNLLVFEQHFFIVNRHLRQFIQMIDDLAAHFSGQISVFNFADVQPGLSEQAGAVRFHRAHVIGILMSDENVPNGLRIDAQPAHFLFQSIIVVARVDHDGRAAFAVKENIRHPFAHTGDMLVNPSRIQRLENLFAAIHFAHFLFLEFGCFPGHELSLFPEYC